MTDAQLQTPSDMRLGLGLVQAQERLIRSSTPRLDVELLASHVLQRSRSWVIGNQDCELRPDLWREFWHLVERRSHGEPVAYLRGRSEWFSMDLEATPAVLIPRPETEVLADVAIGMATAGEFRLAADIGTGGGAIALALAHSVPRLQVHAVDTSAAALEVARRNGHRLGLSQQLTFHRGNLLEPLERKPDLVVANLPYVATELLDTLPAPVRYEPRGALDGGADGLGLYRSMFGQMTDREWRVPFAIEIDPRQTPAVHSLILNSLPNFTVSVFHDYAGKERVVTGQPPL